MKNAIRSCAMLAIICFFLPFFTVSCSDQSKDISGLDIAKGIEGASEGNPLILIIILLAILLIISTFAIKAKLTHIIVNTLVSLFGLVVMYVVHNEFIRQLSELGIGAINLSNIAEVRYGFWGCVISFGVSLLVPIITIKKH